MDHFARFTLQWTSLVLAMNFFVFFWPRLLCSDEVSMKSTGCKPESEGSSEDRREKRQTDLDVATEAGDFEAFGEIALSLGGNSQSSHTDRIRPDQTKPANLP